MNLNEVQVGFAQNDLDEPVRTSFVQLLSFLPQVPPEPERGWDAGVLSLLSRVLKSAFAFAVFQAEESPSRYLTTLAPRSSRAECLWSGLWRSLSTAGTNVIQATSLPPAPFLAALLLPAGRCRSCACVVSTLSDKIRGCTRLWLSLVLQTTVVGLEVRFGDGGTAG